MFSPTFHISGPCRDTRIYNNLIYIAEKPNPSIDRTLLQMDNWGGPWPEETKFWNNIFVTEDRTTYDNGKATGTEFKNNLYFGRHENRPADPMAIVADPRFVGAEKMATGRETLSRFGLASDSPCIGKGIVVPDFGGKDFFGRASRTIGRHRSGRSSILHHAIKSIIEPRSTFFVRGIHEEHSGTRMAVCSFVPRRLNQWRGSSMPASRDQVDGVATSSSRIRKTMARTESISTIGTTMAIWISS